MREKNQMSDLIKAIGSPEALRGAATMLKAAIAILKRHQELNGTMEGLQAILEGLLAEVESAPKCKHERVIPYLTPDGQGGISQDGYMCYDCSARMARP